jgi:hypothetical protein
MFALDSIRRSKTIRRVSDCLRLTLPRPDAMLCFSTVLVIFILISLWRYTGVQR